MAKTLTFSMAIDIHREEVLLPNDRRSITTKTNVNRTNKPSTTTGHLQGTLCGLDDGRQLLLGGRHSSSWRLRRRLYANSGL